MHKLHQRSLPLDPTGIILKKLAVTVQGSFKLFVCIKLDPQDEEILTPCSYKYNCTCSLTEQNTTLKNLYYGLTQM